MNSLDETRRRSLEDRANEARKKRSASAQPLVVEFAGSPKSGKSTNIDILCHFFKRMGFKIWAPTEGASKRTPYSLKRDLVAFNTWSLNYAISELLVAYHNIERHDLIVLDRGPFDSLAWMTVLHGRGELGLDELNTIKAFALHPKWSKLISRVYLFKCEADTSLRRELESKLTHGQGTAMNESMLNDLLDKYNSLLNELRGYPVKTFDTTTTKGPLDTAEPIAQDILEIMEAANG